MSENNIILIDKNALQDEKEREIVFVNKNFAGLIKQLGEIEGTKAEIYRSIAEIKGSAELDLEFLDDLIKNYQKMVDDKKEKLKEVEYQESEEIHQIIDSLNNKRKEIREKMNEITEGAAKAKTELQQLQKSIDKVNIFGLEKLLELVSRFNAMPEKDKELLAKMFEVYKKD